MDTVSPGERSRIMARVRSHATAPEKIVRKLVYSMGYRYRLNRRDLPGCPDLTITSRRKVIFVHGCFWHQHSCTRGARVPSSRVEYWGPKLARNRQRDAVNLRRLKNLGWSPVVIWECELKHPGRVEKKLRTRLASRPQ